MPPISISNSAIADSFVLPKNLIGRFAVVKLWPEIKAAEDECIARIKIAAVSFGIECVEVHADGTAINDPSKKVSYETVDFVLHLHYDTPKLYDAFSIVALWNPLQFYREWGYERCTRNLLSHDDFISCSSDSADDHVARLVYDQATHLPPAFHLYHSTAGVVHQASLGDGKLFYAGINWEAINGGKSRHGEVLKRLDKTGLLRIYGPQKFQGVQVWKGYQSYVREIPFDGVSMLDEISKAGIALVLSSKAHKDAELMSNRLFESIASGALIICDENAFARKFFGDSLLYIDTRCSVEQIYEDIQAHLKWAKEQPEQVLALITRAQSIFTANFTLRGNLATLYAGLEERKQALKLRSGIATNYNPRVLVNLLMPEYSAEILHRQIDNARRQTYWNSVSRLMIDVDVLDKYSDEIHAAVASSGRAIEVAPAAFFDHGPTGRVTIAKKLGEVLLGALSQNTTFDAFMFVAPNETILSNHVEQLAAALSRDENTHCVASAATLDEKHKVTHTVSEKIDFLKYDEYKPQGFARFMFRSVGVPANISSALRYLDKKCMAALIGSHSVVQILPSTVAIDIQREFPSADWNEANENDVLFDFRPESLRLRSGIWPSSETREAATVGVSSIWRMSKLINPRWIKGQIKAIQKQGLKARVEVLKRKLKQA